jgi:hypothetical protein
LIEKSNEGMLIIEEHEYFPTPWKRGKIDGKEELANE